jgi:hypothetical protein
MIKVVVVNNRKVVKQFEFNERKDEEAVKKAFIECDRATWNFEPGNIIALYQNKQLLRHYSDPDKGWVHVNNNGIYNIGD